MKSGRNVLLGLVFLSLGAALPAAEGAQEPAATPKKKAAEPLAMQARKGDEETTGPQRGFKFRNLGPAAGGGRVTALAGVPGNPNVIYVGSASGGVWKTTDGGVSFKPIFENYPASIGAIAIAPSNPNLVWVGTGEANPRNNVIDGHGVYFSPDAGASWRRMGLEDAGQISRVLVDPGDPNTVFVAALGNVWKPNAERGVFRSTDGGRLRRRECPRSSSAIRSGWKNRTFEERLGPTGLTIATRDREDRPERFL